MSRFFGKTFEGFVTALCLAVVAFGVTAPRNGHPELIKLLTPEKLPLFALEVVGGCAAAGLAWAIIDGLTRGLKT